MTGIVPSAEFNEQIKRAVRETVRRTHPNVGNSGRWHKKGGSGAVHIMAFEIIDADCAEGFVTTDATSIERYTLCSTPPGADDYGVYLIEDYFGFISDLTEAELIGVRALAIYWNVYGACTKQWDLLMVEWNGGCDAS
jgi:hypothetical protein